MDVCLFEGTVTTRDMKIIGSSSVSYCRATVDVVLKHPVMVFIARRCIDVRLFTCDVAGEFRVSSGRCQMAAAY